MLREDGTGAIEYFYGKMGEVTKTRRTMIVPNQAIATYVTQWTYDSHNRLLEMIYPDEEKVTYTYDLGGQLTNVHGEKSYGYDYVNRIGYDKFGQRIMEGHPIGTFYTYEWAGYNNQGVSIFYVHDPETGERTGETTTDPETDRDRTITGCAQPDLNLGWSNNFQYKNWNLDLFFTGVLGQDIYNATAEQYSNVSFVKEGRNVLKSVATEHRATDTQSQAPSNRWIENGSYFRLSSVSLGYTFGKIGNWINSLKLYATCNNVFTITGYSGRDPEINLGGLEPGMDRRTNYYPRTRSFMIGVNMNF